MKIKVPENQNKQEVVEAVMTQLKDIYEARFDWQVQYDRTNGFLYDLLASCLDVYLEIKGTPVEKDVLKAMTAELERCGFVVRKNTRVINLIVRYVFNAGRKRTYIYARILSLAVNQKITPSNLRPWIENSGGIEEVSKTKGATPETIKKRAELAEKIEEVYELLNKQLKNPLAMVPITELMDIASSGEYTLLIGKTLPSGETQVLSVVPDSSSTMIDSSIKKIAEALMSKEKIDHERSSSNKSFLDNALYMPAILPGLFDKSAAVKTEAA